MRRVKLLVVAMFLLPIVGGCNKDRMDLHKVTGTVKFEDGTIPQGETSNITFSPRVAMEGKAASSKIESDGTFSLWTLRPGDGGALAGDYRVIVTVADGYPDLKSKVAKEFSDAEKTPLEASVKDAGKNHFDFVVQKSN